MEITLSLLCHVLFAGLPIESRKIFESKIQKWKGAKMEGKANCIIK